MSGETRKLKVEVAVLGAGPGGYPAAFHAADLGRRVALIDQDSAPGGVCLYHGCIPSKAFLHAANIIRQAAAASQMGITFGKPEVGLARLREWKQSVVSRLAGGLTELTAAHGITFVQGTGVFTSPHEIVVTHIDGSRTQIAFDAAILAAGSTPVRLPFLPEDDKRIMDSATALELDDIPQTLLVVGGGYIGLELGQVFAALGTRVSVVEMTAGLLSGVDADLVKVLEHELQARFEKIMLETRLLAVDGSGERLVVQLQREGESEHFTAEYDKMLVAVGRRPATSGLGLENTAVELDEAGFVKVDAQRRTAEPSIFAVGDIAGQPMLAHKATHEGRMAAEAICCAPGVYAPRAIPAVVFTDPEIAWCGITGDAAGRSGMDVRIGAFPWQASGRAATLDQTRGLTKIIAAAADGRVLGMGIVGQGAAELIGEGVLAMEMGAVAEDLALTIHAHPSLSETIMEAAENVLGHSTHSPARK